MRKLMVSDMNDMRHQQEDLKRAAGQGVIDADDDPIRLKLALKVSDQFFVEVRARCNDRLSLACFAIK